jgi:hypothetical protein
VEKLILGSSFLCSTLIRLYAHVAAEMANCDLSLARILADTPSLPQARLCAKLFVARTVLGNKTFLRPALSANGLNFNFGFRIVV